MPNLFKAENLQLNNALFSPKAFDMGYDQKEVPLGCKYIPLKDNFRSSYLDPTSNEVCSTHGS